MSIDLEIILFAAIPAILPKPKNICAPEDTEEAEGSSVKPSKMTFRLLGRDNKGRVETRHLMVPSENKIAAKLLQKGEKDRQQKELLKEKTLLYDTMSSESETQSVAYLGNKDHFSGGDINSRAPSQRSLDNSSQSWKSGSNTTGGSDKEPPGSSYSLDLDGFLAVARTEETKKFSGAVKEGAGGKSGKKSGR